MILFTTTFINYNLSLNYDFIIITITEKYFIQLNLIRQCNNFAMH
jgi:hypothetical protein